MELSLPWLLGCSAGCAVFFIGTALGVMSMTKVSPMAFHIARFCVVAAAVVPLITVWYGATQFQMPWFARAAIGVVGSIAIGLPVVVLLRLVNENEGAHYGAGIAPESDNKQTPKFRIESGPNIKISWSTNTWGNVPVRFLHPAVSLDSGTITNCKGYLTRIARGDKEWVGQEQLTFSPSEARDSLSKTLHSGVTYTLDVLAITSDGAIHVCNEKREWRRWPSLRDIFTEPGSYCLDVAIAGDGVTAQIFSLNFNWTGNWQTSLLTLQNKPTLDTRVTYEETDQIIEIFKNAPRVKVAVTSLSVEAGEEFRTVMERAGWFRDALNKAGVNTTASFWGTLGSVPNGTNIWWKKNALNNDMAERIIRAAAIKGLHPMEVQRPVSAGDSEIELMIGRNPN